jgi:hypothetical protein
MRGNRLRADRDPASHADLVRAEQSFRKILELDPGNETADYQLEKLSQFLVDKR